MHPPAHAPQHTAEHVSQHVVVDECVLATIVFPGEREKGGKRLKYIPQRSLYRAMGIFQFQFQTFSTHLELVGANSPNVECHSRDGGGAERGWAAANSLKQCRRRGIDAEACYGLCSQLPRDPCRARALTRHATSEWCVSTRAGSRTHPAAPRGCWSPTADAARGHHELTDPGGAGAHAVCGGDIACVWQRLGRVRHRLC